MKRILIVEDNPEVQIVLKRTLSQSYSIDTASSLAEAREFLKNREVHLMILDIMLPDGDGLRFCAEVNSSQKQRIPILILSGKTALEDKALGFQLGIEDFITKPFDPMELKIRVDARIKKESESGSDILQVGDVKILLSKQRVEIEDSAQAVDLSSKEFGIFVYLAKNPETIKTRTQILDEVWGSGVHLTDRSVDSHISRLRKRLASSSIEIEAVKNAGYRIRLKKKQAA